MSARRSLDPEHPRRERAVSAQARSAGRDAASRIGKILVVSDYYYPDDISTGYFLTGIAEGLARRFRVEAICGSPLDTSRANRVLRAEVRHGVTIRRYPALGGKDKGLLSRALRNISLALASSWASVRALRQHDLALVVTNPPLLPFGVALACRLRGADCLLLVHDLYPEVLVATGLLSRGSPVVRLLAGLHALLYRRMRCIIVLGRDAKSQIARRCADLADRIVVIPNWGDPTGIRPEPAGDSSLLLALGLRDKFVVQFSGNLGRTHDVEGVVACARLLAEHPEVHFLMSGWGSKRPWLEAAVRELPNVTLLERQARDDLAKLLNGAHLHLIAFIRGMAGVSVPSRMYNIMAAGKPILGAGEPDSELARVIGEERIGWVVPAEEPQRMAEAILEARAAPARCAEMGVRARRAAEERYSAESVIGAYLDLFDEIAARR